MKPIDFKSVVIAGAIGAAVLFVVEYVFSDEAQATQALSKGFAVGALVQMGVRIAGVS